MRVTNDVGRQIVNYPQQQYDNAVAKHRRTNDRFKKMVRIVKNLAVEMDDAGVAAAKPIPSFLIESLVYNVPDENFDRVTFCSELRSVLAYLFNETRTDESCSKWVEENGLKWLFRDQTWTRQQAHAFISAAWDYVGLE